MEQPAPRSTKCRPVFLPTWSTNPDLFSADLVDETWRRPVFYCRLGRRILTHFFSFPFLSSQAVRAERFKDPERRNVCASVQGCQMVCFQTKNPNLGKFWRVLQWKVMVYFKDTLPILRSFVILYGHLV
jgi:hypothetical protein